MKLMTHEETKAANLRAIILADNRTDNRSGLEYYRSGDQWVMGPIVAHYTIMFPNGVIELFHSKEKAMLTLGMIMSHNKKGMLWCGNYDINGMCTGKEYQVI